MRPADLAFQPDEDERGNGDERDQDDRGNDGDQNASQQFRQAKLRQILHHRHCPSPRGSRVGLRSGVRGRYCICPSARRQALRQVRTYVTPRPAGALLCIRQKRSAGRGETGLED